MTEKRFRLAEHLLETRPWDLFFMVEMGTDRMHHGKSVGGPSTYSKTRLARRC